MADGDLYAFDGVILKCDKGATVLPLKTTPKKHAISGLQIATVTDNVPIVNIPSFGTCSITGSSCTPVAPQWIKEHDGAQKILSQAPLLITSYCKCQAGGTIEIFLSAEEANASLKSDKENRVDGISWLDGALGTALTSPIGPIMDMFTDGDHDITEGVGRGFRKGLKGTWNGLVQMVKHPIDTAKGLTKLAGIAVVGYGGGSMVPASVKLQQFDSVFGTDLAPTHDAIGAAIEDGWDKKVVHGTTEERSELVGQVYEGVLEAVVGTKGAGAAVKGITSGAKMALGAERLAVITEAIANLQKAMKLEEMAAAVKGIFKVGELSEIFADASKLVKSRVSQLEAQIPINSKGRITMGVAVVEDQNGVRKILVSTSEKRGYLRPGVELKEGEQMIVGTGHAEADIINYANSNNLKVIDIGATRPVCSDCAKIISTTDENISTPLKK